MHNYLACVGTALLVFGSQAWDGISQQSAWTLHGIMLGALFITGFSIFALAVRFWGIGLISAVQKMSLAGSALFAWWFFQEQLTWMAGTGILLAFGAIPLLVLRRRDPLPSGEAAKSGSQYLVIATFVLSVLIESGLMVVERTVAETSADPGFLALLFLSAFGWGLLLLSVSSEDRQAFFTRRHLLAGWLLGIPNFFSIYFLMKAFSGALPITVTIPIINVGTILLTVVAGFLLFSEYFTRQQKTGLLVGVLAILFMSFS